jgi:tetratricopeptide (TPR) repeat protein
MIPGKLCVTGIIVVVFLCGLVAGCDECGFPSYDEISDWWDDRTADNSDRGSGGGTDPGGSGTGDAGNADTDAGSETTSGSDTGTPGGTGGETSDGTSSAGSGSGGSYEDAIIWRMKGDDLFLTGEYNQSLDAYQKSTRIDPYVLKSWIGMGTVLLALDRPEEAADAFEKATRLDPGNADPYVLLGDALAAGEQYEQAEVAYLKALAMNPNLKGVDEKISGIQEAHLAMVQAANGTVTSTLPPSIVETDMETATIAIDNGTVADAVNTVPQAGVAGFPVLLFSLFICSALLAFRKR